MAPLEISPGPPWESQLERLDHSVHPGSGFVQIRKIWVPSKPIRMSWCSSAKKHFWVLTLGEPVDDAKRKWTWHLLLSIYIHIYTVLIYTLWPCGNQTSQWSPWPKRCSAVLLVIYCGWLRNPAGISFMISVHIRETHGNTIDIIVKQGCYMDIWWKQEKKVVLEPSMEYERYDA